MKTILIIALSLIALLTVAGFTYQSKPQVWEYKIYGARISIEVMNELGAEGWELVTVAPDATSTAIQRPGLYFKRPKP